MKKVEPVLWFAICLFFAVDMAIQGGVEVLTYFSYAMTFMAGMWFTKVID